MLAGSSAQWAHADSDVLRRDMDAFVGRAAGGKTPKRIIVDKCNETEAGRRLWPAVAHQPPAQDCMLVVFGTTRL